MVFFPLLLQALVELVDRRTPFRPDRRVLVACAALTGGVFAATNVWEPAADAYRFGLGVLQWPFRALGHGLSGGPLPPLLPVSLTRDPTDLIAVPFVAVAVWVGRRR